MGIVYTKVKPVRVDYQCDNCKLGIVELLDSYKEKGDDGENHTIYTYKCPICGVIDSLYDIKYPYIDFIPDNINCAENKM